MKTWFFRTLARDYATAESHWLAYFMAPMPLEYDLFHGALEKKPAVSDSVAEVTCVP